MRGEKGDVGAVDLGEAILMGNAGVREPLIPVQPRLSMVSPDEKAARAASWVEDGILRLADAEGIDHVHEIFVGVVLAELVPFLRFDERFEDAAQDVRANLLEIEGAEIFQNGAPSVE